MRYTKTSKTTNKGGISRYCQKSKISIVDLSELVDISFSQLYLIDKDPLYPVKVETIEEIYKKTKSKFKEALKPQSYLDFEIFKLSKSK